MILHLTSNEPYLISNEISKELKKLNISKGDMDYLETKNLEQLENFVNSYSLFSPIKIAVVKELEDEKLIKIFENVGDDLLIIMASPLDKRKKLYKWLSKKKFIKDIPIYKKVELINWIKELGVKWNCKITNDMANEILKLTGENDMYNIEQEVYKLTCMNTKLTKELIQTVVRKSSMVVSFDLTNSILKKDLNKSLSILQELIEKNETMIPIIALLNKNFSVIRSLKEVDDSVLKESGIDYYTLKNLRPYAYDKKLYTNAELERYIKLTEKADFELKNGVDEKLIMEKLIISISMGGE